MSLNSDLLDYLSKYHPRPVGMSTGNVFTYWFVLAMDEEDFELAVHRDHPEKWFMYVAWKALQAERSSDAE